MFQAVGNGSFEITQFAAAVVAFAVEGMGEDELVIQQAGNAVGQLDFVACAAWQVFQKAEKCAGSGCNGRQQQDWTALLRASVSLQYW